MSTSTTPNVEIYKCSFGQTAKLTDFNFIMWKSDIQIMLTGEGLLGIVLGTEALPPAGNSRAVIEATERYQARVDKAYSLLAGSCSLAIRDHFQGTVDPAAIWNILNEKFNTANSQAGQMALARAFQRLRPHDDDTSINQFISRLLNIRNQLAGTEEEISEKRLVSQILMSLPSAYEPTIQMITFAPREQQTLEFVVNTLLETEKGRNNRLDVGSSNAGSSLTSGSALAAYSRENSRGRGSRGNSRSRSRGSSHSRGRSRGRGGIQKSTSNDDEGCWHCGISGHTRKECRKRKREQKQKQQDDKPSDDRPQGSVAIARASMAIRCQAFTFTNGRRNGNRRMR
jgi:hypothetical protein